jgi:DNA-directed RNA polymerase specialized sigma24 family protein
MPLADVIPFPGPDACGAAIERQRLRAVLDGLNGLSVLERRALIGFALAGMSYDEIADGATTKQVDNAIQRGRRKLRKLAA